MAKFFAGENFFKRDFGHDALHVYQREGDSPVSSVVVLVHGFNGSGYGTWGSLPEVLLEEESARFDVALYDYLSGMRRRLNDSPDTESIIEHLIEELESLSYDSIFLVGHSMGGLIAMGAIREAYSRGHTSASPLTKRIRCLFTLATPLAGTRWLPFGVFPIRERGALRVHSDLQHENARFFADSVNVETYPNNRKSLWIPHFTAKATGDRVVNKFSSTASTPSHRRRTFRGSHSNFLRGDQVAPWLVSSMVEVGQIQESERRTPRYLGRLSASFKGHPLYGSWVDSYHAALTQFSLDKNIPVDDMTGRKVAGPIALSVEVVHCSDAEKEQTRASLLRDVRTKEQRNIRAMGISIFGTAKTDPLADMAALTRDQPSVWIVATPSLSDLTAEIVRWLNRAHILAAAPESSLQTPAYPGLLLGQLAREELDGYR